MTKLLLALLGAAALSPPTAFAQPVKNGEQFYNLRLDHYPAPGH